MSGGFDKLKGKAKEKTGKLTDNERLEAEGLVDQGKGKAKEFGDEVRDRVSDAVDGDDKGDDE